MKAAARVAIGLVCLFTVWPFLHGMGMSNFPAIMFGIAVGVFIGEVLGLGNKPTS